MATPGVTAGWADVSAYSHTCGIAAGSRAAYCWGPGSHGQLGVALGNISYTVSVPVPVAAIAGVSAGWAEVSVGELHTCGIAESTRVAYCWGAKK